MMQLRTVSPATVLLLAGMAFAQPCPKVTYTTQAATLRKLVTAVNCLVGSTEKTEATPTENTTGLQVDTFHMVGPQHSRSYRKIVVVLLVVPAGETTKTALATAENPEAKIAATGGAQCKVTLNHDNTVDGQCNLTGGTFYVVYHN
ncbi:MAG TPA: hypothetical protein VMT28_12370 [Terriglobales bacterium]|jgi:hypothetical protein|nr:hypothetical protein [Terriglobales bacterium]